MMTAEQFWFDGHVCKQHKRGCCDECMQHVARADAHAVAQLAEKEREIARLQDLFAETNRDLVQANSRLRQREAELDELREHCVSEHECTFAALPSPSKEG